MTVTSVKPTFQQQLAQFAQKHQLSEEEMLRLLSASIEQNQALDSYRLLAEHSTDLISVHTPEGIYTYASPACVRLLGYAPEELIGKSSYEFFHQDDLDAIWTSHTTIIERPDVYTVAYRIRHRDGHYLWFETTSQMVRDEQGIREIIAISRDITARKQVEDVLRQREQQFRAQYKSLPLPTFTWRREGENFVLIDYNDAALRFTQGMILEILGKTANDLYQSDMPEMIAYFEQAYRRQTSFQRPMQYRLRSTGQDKFLIVTFAYVPPDLLMCHLEDISERKQAEDRLRQLSRAVEQSASIIVITNREGRIEYVNSRFTEVTGYTPDEAIGQNPRVLQSGSTPKSVYKNLWNTITVGREWRGEFQNRKKNGELYWVSATISPIRDGHGEITHFIGVEEDITQRKQAEEALRLSEVRLNTVVQVLSSGIMLIGQDGIIQTCNASASRFLGISAGQHLEEVAVRAVHEDGSHFRGDEYPSLITLQTGIPQTNIIAGIIQPDSSIVWLSINTQPLIHAGETKPYAVVSSMMDITALKQTLQERDELIQELDAYAHTVAHDLKNPLHLIVGYASLLSEEFDQFEPQDVVHYLKNITGTSYKMKTIIDALLLLASTRKMEAVDVAPLNTAAILEEAKQRLIYLIEETNAEITHPEQFPVAIGYAPWVEEVWANYLSNALKYGGSSPMIRIGAEQLPDGMVRFWIRDNGGGLTAEQIRQLFVPFKRTGQPGVKGHGLGLSIVKHIVERLGGQVAVESEPGQGCLFSFVLPGLSSEIPQ